MVVEEVAEEITEQDERGEPTCKDGQYHDWTYVESTPPYHYCAVCGYVEVDRRLESDG